MSVVGCNDTYVAPTFPLDERPPAGRGRETLFYVKLLYQPCSTMTLGGHTVFREALFVTR
jgi:hypothetical protein